VLEFLGFAFAHSRRPRDRGAPEETRIAGAVGGLELARVVEQGDAALSFYRLALAA